MNFVGEMNASRKTIFCLLAAVLGAGLSPAFARGNRPEGRFSLSPSVGYYAAFRLGNLVPLAHTADVPGVEILIEPKSPEGGLSLGYALSRRFEIQAAAFASRARIMDDVGIGLAGIPLGKMKVSDAVFWTLGARLLYNFAIGKFAPYLAAGFGIAALNTDKIGSRTRPTVELGAGLKVRLSRRLKAVLELRDAVSFFRYFEDFRIAYIMIYTAEVQGVQHRPCARLGLEYLF